MNTYKPGLPHAKMDEASEMCACLNHICPCVQLSWIRVRSSTFQVRERCIVTHKEQGVHVLGMLEALSATRQLLALLWPKFAKI